MRDYRLAEIAYNGYCAQTGGISLISGDKLPEFDNLKIEIKDAWFSAARAVEISLNEYIKKYAMES